MKRLYAFVAVGCILAVGACDDESAPEDSDEAVVDQQQNRAQPQSEDDEQLHPIWGAWTPDDDLEALQGEWNVSGSPGPDEHWKIDGDTVVVESDGESPKEGTIELPHPGVVQFVVESNGGSMTTTYSFAREGDDLYLGLGHSGVVLSDRYVFRRANHLLVYRDGECTYHDEDRFDGFDEEGQTIDCELVDDEETKRLVYTDPDGQSYTRDQRIEVGDEAITDGQLRGSRLQTP